MPCDNLGNVKTNYSDLGLNAKSGLTYNHEKTWSQLSSKYTRNKPYNYYPRGGLK